MDVDNQKRVAEQYRRGAGLPSKPQHVDGPENPTPAEEPDKGDKGDK